MSRENEGRYDDIIDLPAHVSATHPHMSNADRAAQFSPFAALTGYDAAIAETARLTDMKKEMSEVEIDEVNQQLLCIERNLEKHPRIRMTYFIKDERKEGGRYESNEITVRQIDVFRRCVIAEDKSRYAFDQIRQIRILDETDQN